MAWNALTDEDREAVIASLPGAIDGFLKGWGWQQFAQAIEDKCREKNRTPEQIALSWALEVAATALSDRDAPESEWDKLFAADKLL